MKNLLLTFTLLASLMTLAQQTEEPVNFSKNIIKTDVTELLLTTNYHLNASWEHLMSKKASLQLDLYFSNYGDLTYDEIYTQLGVSYRFYFNRHINQMRGFYVAPAVRLHWGHASGVYNVSDYDVLFPTAGFNLGYQWVIKKKWTLDLFTDWQVDLSRMRLLGGGYGTMGIKFGYKF